MTEPTPHELAVAAQAEVRAQEGVEPLGQTILDALVAYREQLEHQVGRHLVLAAEEYEQKNRTEKAHAIGAALRIQALELAAGAHRAEREGAACWQCGARLQMHEDAGVAGLVCPVCDEEQAQELGGEG